MIWTYFRESPEFRKRILTTFAILAIYRLGAYIPAPGIDQQALRESLQSQGSLFGFINLLSGGTLTQFCILGLGILPFINASQIVRWFLPLIPGLKRAVDADPREGQRLLNRMSLYLTFPLAMFSSFALLRYLSFNCTTGLESSPQPGLISGSLATTLLVLIVMSTGAMFSVFLSQQIDEYGMRNQGVNLLLFSGIPTILIAQLARLGAEPNPLLELGIYFAFLILGTFFTILVLGARRNVPVVYPGRRIGNRMSVSVTGSIPLSLPLTFDAAENAQGCLVFPAIVAGFLVCSNLPWLSSAAQTVYGVFQQESMLFPILLFLLAVMFTFLLSSIHMAEENYGEKLKWAGAQIPGVMRGQPTQRYLERIASQIALPAALYLGVLLIFPWLIQAFLGQAVPLIAGSTIYFLCVVIRDVVYAAEVEAKVKGYDSHMLIH